MFGQPPVCLDAPQMNGGIQRYEGHPNIWVMSKYMEVSKHTGEIQTYGSIQMDAPKCMGASKGIRDIQTNQLCPNIWEYPNIQGASKHMGASKCIGGIWTPP